ncbi:conserved hypothetical protein, secreted [Candidatus Magnetomorum sp. HK-1]|nr:conserved hypothetical protein, secreted [Candidatus Magnetomorum sp. HK-1]
MKTKKRWIYSLIFIGLFVAVSPAQSSLPNIQSILENIVLDRADENNPLLFLPKDTVEFTLEISSLQETLESLCVSFGIKLNDGQILPINIIDSISQNPVSSITIENIQSEIAKSMAVLLKFPENIVERIQEAFQKYSEQFEIVAWIDNLKESPVSVTDLLVVNLPKRYENNSPEPNQELPSDLDWYEEFHKSFVHNNYGATIDAYAYAKFNDDGASAGAHAETDLTLLDNSFQLAQVDAKILAAPHKTDDSYVDIDVQYMGNSIWTYHWANSLEILEGENERVFIKEKHYVKDMTIIIVPIHLEAGGYGALGIEWKMEIDENTQTEFMTKFKPVVDVAGYARLDVDLGIASGSVKGNLSLIENEFVAEVIAQMIEENDQLEGALSFVVENDLQGPKGDISIYVSWNGTSTCMEERCLFGICVPVPVQCSQEGEDFMPLADWEFWKAKDVLINTFDDLRQNVALISLNQ